jgi:hypothetical protein
MSAVSAVRLLNLKSLLGLGIILVSICIDLSIANCAEFQHPTRYRNYTGFFNEERCLKGTKYPHKGLDIVGYEGEKIRGGEVRPYAEGTVKKADWSDKIGWYVIIDHGGGLKTKYAHLLEKPPVKEGKRVALNDKIGEIDNTGKWSTGDHLHFQVELNGEPIDPFSFLPRDEYVCRSKRACCKNDPTCKKDSYCAPDMPCDDWTAFGVYYDTIPPHSLWDPLRHCRQPPTSPGGGSPDDTFSVSNQLFADDQIDLENAYYRLAPKKGSLNISNSAGGFNSGHKLP